MNLQNLSVIFIIIAIPIILVTSYYISLQTDTIKMQTSYDSKLVSSAKEAIKAFETNTVEWNEELSKTADSKRRDVMASINTFVTAFANNTGMTGATKESILPYIPAIAFTLYDGYYIYSPSEIKNVEKNDNGLTKFDEQGNIIYRGDTTYSHILKPFIPYSARYKTGDIDIVINYTLDNYITIYGTIDGGRNSIIKSGYLEANLPNTNPYEVETLKERIAWKREDEENYTEDEYEYVYAEDNTKVYFDGNTTFSVNPNNIRTDLTEKTGVAYKKIAVPGKDGYGYVYQALVSWDLNKDNIIDEEKEIKQGNWYKAKGDPKTKIDNMGVSIKKDVSAINYYIETKEFNNWINNNLKNLNTNNIVIDDNIKNSEISRSDSDKIFEDYGEDSVFNQHKREVIKQTMINNLNQAITSYSRNSKVEGEFKLPKLTETDWDQIVNNVSIIAFMQEIPIGMKYYNNYVIATSTLNKEYVNPNEIYLSAEGDDYYHMPYCKELQGDNIIGYRNTDYAIKSYYPNENDKDTIKYYYRHQDLASQECYYCLVQRDLYDPYKSDEKEIAYNTALARERYNNRITRMDTVELEPEKFTISFDANGGSGSYGPIESIADNAIKLPSSGFERDGYTLDGWEDVTYGGTYTTDEEYTVKGDATLKAIWKRYIPKELNLTITINPTNKGWQTEIYTLVSDLELSYEKDGMYNTTISYQNKDEEHSYYRGTYSSEMYKKRINNVRFPTGGSAITQYYDITITTTDRDGNKYEGNTEIKSLYLWNGLGIFFGTAKYYESFYFNGDNSSETITLKLVE